MHAEERAETKRCGSEFGEQEVWMQVRVLGIRVEVEACLQIPGREGRQKFGLVRAHKEKERRVYAREKGVHTIEVRF